MNRAVRAAVARDRAAAAPAEVSVIEFGFGPLGLHRIFARHMARNPASGAVMRKLGLHYEGRQREHAFRRGRFEDLEVYGLLSREWTSCKEQNRPS